MATCTNCGATLAGEFCQDCGQRRFVESDRRLSYLLHQFLASATDLDGRVWRTLRALLFQPGLLSHEYFAGRRARWVAPASLFLTVSVVYFIAPFHGGDLSLQFNQQVTGHIRTLALAPDEKLAADEKQAEQLRTSSGQLHSPYTEALIERRVRERDAAARTASGGAAGYSYHDYRIAYDAKADDVSKGLVILHMPFVALALMLAFIRQRHYFAEHFVFALHFFAFELLLLQIVVQFRAVLLFALPVTWLPPEALYDWVMRVLLPLYVVLALRRAYAVGWPGAIAAATVMLAVVIAANLVVYRAVQFLITFALT